MSFVFALLAAVANAVSNVLQRKANRTKHPDVPLRFSGFLMLMRRPAWLGGVGAMTVSFVFLVAALKTGHLAAVEPVIVFELPLTVALASKAFHAHLGRREWIAIASMTMGLGGLILFLGPHGGNGGAADGLAWGVASAVTVSIVAYLILLARRCNLAMKPILLGLASGMAFGLTAAYMKGMTIGLTGGVPGVLSRWQTYAMVICGIASTYTLQHALHAGRLVAAQPGITLADPLVAMLWGVLVFGEQVHHGLSLALAVASGLLMAAASIWLAHSPLLQDAVNTGTSNSADNAEDDPAVAPSATIATATPPGS